MNHFVYPTVRVSWPAAKMSTPGSGSGLDPRVGTAGEPQYLLVEGAVAGSPVVHVRPVVRCAAEDRSRASRLGLLAGDLRTLCHSPPA